MAKKTKWVSAKERTPPRREHLDEESELVLCYENDAPLNPFVGWYSYIDRAWYVAHWSSGDSDIDVLYWRPLPKPPPGEEWDR